MTTTTTRTTTVAAALVPAVRSAPGGPQHGDLGRLLVRCQDQPGIVAAVSTFLTAAGANVVSLAQHSTAPEGGTFFQRTEFHLPALPAALPDLHARFAEQVAAPFQMDFTLTDAAHHQRVALMVSRTDHCAMDLLWRTRRGELPMTVAMVISNHPDLAEEVRSFGVPFVHVPATRDNRAQAEARVLELLAGNVDLVVLARYMQIITPAFLERVGCPLINIHHSFLPAFIGAGPYAKAKQRGVKLIGATAHYVTAELDEGPIIEQDVVRVGHQHDTPDLVRLGADVERAVLSRAVRWHLEDRVLRHEGTTVVL
ncbi:MAG: formyltetrahydrofolate deformylase [Quadrisphaera sp.]